MCQKKRLLHLPTSGKEGKPARVSETQYEHATCGSRRRRRPRARERERGEINFARPLLVLHTNSLHSLTHSIARHFPPSRRVHFVTRSLHSGRSGWTQTVSLMKYSFNMGTTLKHLLKITESLVGEKKAAFKMYKMFVCAIFRKHCPPSPPHLPYRK